MAESSPLRTLLASKSTEAFRYGPDKPLVVLRSHWPIDRALKVLLKHNITAAVSACVQPTATPLLVVPHRVAIVSQRSSIVISLCCDD